MTIETSSIDINTNIIASCKCLLSTIISGISSSFGLLSPGFYLRRVDLIGMYYVSHYALLRHVPLECRVNIDNCAACLVCGH